MARFYGRLDVYLGSSFLGSWASTLGDHLSFHFDDRLGDHFGVKLNVILALIWRCVCNVFAKHL